MKKLATALCLTGALMASSAAQAQWEGNWLVGVSGGWNELSGNVTSSVFDTDDNTFESTSTHLKDNSWIWGVLGGYQARCNGWLMGLELNVDWVNHNNDHTTVESDPLVTATTSYKRDTNVALTGRMGFQVAQFFLPYIRAGVETSRDTLSLTTTFEDLTVVDVSNSRRVYRFVAGIGAEIPVPMVTGLSARAEYDYHSKGRSVQTQGLGIDGVTFFQSNTKQGENSAIIALVYNFL